MSEVYSNCTLNISADRAVNADEGCFVHRDLEFLKSVCLKWKGRGSRLRRRRHGRLLAFGLRPTEADVRPFAQVKAAAIHAYKLKWTQRKQSSSGPLW
jgi:hypothetical protein